jgi:FixJ family two-component response regulator
MQKNPQPSIHKDDYQAGKPTVMIVDDDDDLRQMVSEMLHEAGYRTVEMADGISALDLLQQQQEHYIVLLDILLPQLDGAALLGIVARQRSLALHNAFVLMTGKPLIAFPVLRRLAAEMGALILPKPFDMQTLLDAVAQASRTLAHPPPADGPLPHPQM